MSHSIIIISQKADCVASAFSSIASDINNLKSTCISGDNVIPSLSTVLANRMHGKLHEVEDWLTARCDNPQNYAEQEAQMASEANNFITQINAML